ncbi:hypothetical protein [Leptospira vanthielii]|uniref:Uncharacterized protein n=2 Tax=Leptospira vanthielii serovar Holland str. Waz Holland = ATCC 700522 TaxID=1218591 RepID=N1WCP1_9LEPT|nr:hypothetical protein [Leptospira vanthielii]EMY71195.1 hypothetical protein LEP1GSC199_1593 [Leptospira vanthielii serovar Holland str. Waz Holland = ATCC 700522]
MKQTENRNTYFALFPSILGIYYLIINLIEVNIGKINIEDIQFLTIIVLFILSFGIYMNIIYSSISFAAFVLFTFATEYLNSGINFVLIGKLVLALAILFNGIEKHLQFLKLNHLKLINNSRDKLFLGISSLYIFYLIINLIFHYFFTITYIHNKDDFDKADYKFINSLNILEPNEKMQYLFHFNNLGKNNGFVLVSNNKIVTHDKLSDINKIYFSDIHNIEKEIISEDISRLNIFLKSGESINITIPRKRNRDEELFFYINNEIKILSNGV